MLTASQYVNICSIKNVIINERHARLFKFGCGLRMYPPESLFVACLLSDTLNDEVTLLPPVRVHYFD